MATPRKRRGPLRRLRRATRGPRNAVLAAVIRATKVVLGLLPLWLALAIGRGFGHVSYWLLGSRRRLALRHLAEALPEAGAALDRQTRTGQYCAYEPRSDGISWVFSPD